jgi:hypothetical protein
MSKQTFVLSVRETQASDTASRHSFYRGVDGLAAITFGTAIPFNNLTLQTRHCNHIGRNTNMIDTVTTFDIAITWTLLHRTDIIARHLVSAGMARHSKQYLAVYNIFFPTTIWRYNRPHSPVNCKYFHIRVYAFAHVEAKIMGTTT